MGRNSSCSWDDRKREQNIVNHGFDFAGIEEVFDGRYSVTRQDIRFDYGEQRFNILVAFRDRIINVTFTPRLGRFHLISARPASRIERKIYHANKA
jgi:uncharacterized protein